jgi:hypothetical protein
MIDKFTQLNLSIQETGKFTAIKEKDLYKLVASNNSIFTNVLSKVRYMVYGIRYTVYGVRGMDESHMFICSYVYMSYGIWHMSYMTLSVRATTIKHPTIEHPILMLSPHCVLYPPH